MRTSAVQKWTEFISTLAALRSFDIDNLSGIWSAVDCGRSVVTYTSWDYVVQIEKMDASDPQLFQALMAVGHFLFRRKGPPSIVSTIIVFRLSSIFERVDTAQYPLLFRYSVLAILHAESDKTTTKVPMH